MNQNSYRTQEKIVSDPKMIISVSKEFVTIFHSNLGYTSQGLNDSVCLSSCHLKFLFDNFSVVDKIQSYSFLHECKSSSNFKTKFKTLFSINIAEIESDSRAGQLSNWSNAEKSAAFSNDQYHLSFYSSELKRVSGTIECFVKLCTQKN